MGSGPHCNFPVSTYLSSPWRRLPKSNSGTGVVFESIHPQGRPRSSLPGAMCREQASQQKCIHSPRTGCAPLRTRSPGRLSNRPAASIHTIRPRRLHRARHRAHPPSVDYRLLRGGASNGATRAITDGGLYLAADWIPAVRFHAARSYSGSLTTWRTNTLPALKCGARRHLQLIEWPETANRRATIVVETLSTKTLSNL
jgi:hypothetical protein